MGIVAELRGNARQLSAALDEDVVRVVDENVGDGRVSEERLDGSETGDLPDDVLDDLLALRLRQRRRFIAQEFGDGEADLGGDLRFVLDLLQRFEIQPRNEAVMDVDLELVEWTQLLVFDGAGEERRGARRRRDCWRPARPCLPPVPFVRLNDQQETYISPSCARRVGEASIATHSPGPLLEGSRRPTSARAEGTPPRAWSQDGSLRSEYQRSPTPMPPYSR
jgi:hypothetical protein